MWKQLFSKLFFKPNNLFITFFLSSSSNRASSFSRNCICSPSESLRSPVRSVRMWPWSVGTLRETPGSSRVRGAPSSLSVCPESNSFPSKIQDIVSKMRAHKDVAGFRRLGKTYTVRRRRPPANHKTKWDLRTASCFLHTRHRNPANKRATSTTNKRTTIFNISAWQRYRNRRFYIDSHETSGNFVSPTSIYKDINKSGARCRFQSSTYLLQIVLFSSTCCGGHFQSAESLLDSMSL